MFENMEFSADYPLEEDGTILVGSERTVVDPFEAEGCELACESATPNVIDVIDSCVATEDEDGSNVNVVCITDGMFACD